MKQLLIEIGSEEIPARFLSKGLVLLKNALTEFLESSAISYGNISEYATPRRLALLFDNVAEQQDDRTIETLGPPKRAAYDADGKPTKAATGFARSLSIEVKDLTIKDTERGEYVAAVIEQKGRPASVVLSEALPDLISSLQLPKSMRWGDTDLRYFRPLQWILALMGSEIIPFALDSINSSNVTYGHRFLSPAAITISEPSSYVNSLRENNVIADINERKSVVMEGIKEIETSGTARAHEDEELLDTVTNLVEFPTAVMGSFEDIYLALPKELLITVMKAHQKYFSMEDGEGNMKPCFIVISNMNKEINDTVKRGAEKVLRARLEDARFYYHEDQKCSFRDYVEDLKKVTFQEKLGTLHQKALRVASLASSISKQLNPALKEKAEKVSMLCKADLVTGVVGEFPELQGYMGMIYAGNSGEEQDTATAIYEHYMPRFPGDSLPSEDLGRIVSLADKIDNIASFFHLDMIPTGSEDPFALRRQAVGIINILQDSDKTITLNSLIAAALIKLEDTEETRTELTGAILDFFSQRLEGILLAQGYSHDLIRAVLSSDKINIKEIKQKISILSELRKDPGFPGLLMAAKRVYNILAKVQPGNLDQSLLKEEPEKTLHDITLQSGDALSSSNYRSLFELETPVNSFFDKILVMDKDPKVRDNRLALLAGVRSVFSSLADFSQILE